MRYQSSIAVCFFLSQIAGCSGSGFSGSGNTTPTAKTSKSNGEAVSQKNSANKAAPETIKASATPTPSPAPKPTSAVEACSRTGASSIEVTVPTHQDLDAQATGRYGGGMPSSDVAQSQVVRLDLNTIQGDLLPVAEFSLDDIAIIVKENQDLAMASSWDPVSRRRTIKVPADALMIYDGNNPEYASGSVDSGATTIYEFTDRRVTLAGGTSQSLRSVYGLGVPLIAHNKVSLGELKARGFIDASNRVVFKVFHVAHGWGNVTLRFDLKACR